MGHILLQLSLVIQACLMGIWCVQNPEKTQSNHMLIPLIEKTPRIILSWSIFLCVHASCFLSHEAAMTSPLQSVVQRQDKHVFGWIARSYQMLNTFNLMIILWKSNPGLSLPKNFCGSNAPSGIYPEKMFCTVPGAMTGYLGRECTKLCTYQGRNC